MIKTDAQGVQGVLIRTFQNKIVFRVYNEHHEFVDYDILHHDLCVTITDDNAALYDTGKRQFIDYEEI